MNGQKHKWVVCVLVCTAAMLVCASASADWESLGKDDGVDIAKKEVKGSDVFAFRGVTTTDLSIGQLMTVFLDKKQRKHWVDRYESSTTLAKGKNTQTYRIHFGLPFPVSDRDYVLKSVLKPDEDKKVVMVHIKSVKHAKAPENDCCVRAEAYGTYYRFEALDNGKTRLTVEVHTDPKGVLPAWLVNLIQESWPTKTLNGLIRRTKEIKADEHPDFVGWSK